jgi:hypothetical protein
MVVDFEIGSAPAFRGATVAWKGPWSEKRIRSELEGIAKWLKERGAKSGRWFLIEGGTNSFRVAIEVRSPVKGSGRVRVRKFPATAVVRVAFDPDEVSPRVVYHGLNDFLRWRRKDKTIRSVGDYREVYGANPWTDGKAWSNLRIEALVRK